MANLVTIQSFSAPEDALEWVNLLKAHDIPYHWEEDLPGFDHSFAFNKSSIIYNYLLRVPHTHVQKAREVLSEIAADRVSQYDKDHYLYGFELEELYEVLERPDEWSPEDYILAQKILEERGRPMSQQDIETLYKARIDEIRRPRRMDKNWIVVAYVGAVMGIFLGIFGLAAIMLAWSMLFKKTDPTGQKFYTYDLETRTHAKRILIIALVAFTVWTFVFYLFF